MPIYHHLWLQHAFLPALREENARRVLCCKGWLWVRESRTVQVTQHLNGVHLCWLCDQKKPQARERARHQANGEQQNNASPLPQLYSTLPWGSSWTPQSLASGDAEPGRGFFAS